MCKLIDLNTNYGCTIQVADIKKDAIMNIVEAAKECHSISEIILFGSSLAERCKDSSDIDIAVISNITRSKLFNSKKYRDFTKQVYLYKMGQDYDILQFNSLHDLEQSNDAVCHDIKREGKIIYRRT